MHDVAKAAAALSPDEIVLLRAIKSFTARVGGPPTAGEAAAMLGRGQGRRAIGLLKRLETLGFVSRDAPR